MKKSIRAKLAAADQPKKLGRPPQKPRNSPKHRLNLCLPEIVYRRLESLCEMQSKAEWGRKISLVDMICRAIMRYGRRSQQDQKVDGGYTEFQAPEDHLQ